MNRNQFSIAIAFLMGIALLVVQAHAAGAYNPPCENIIHSADEAFEDLRKCFDDYGLDSEKNSLATACSEKYTDAATKFQSSIVCQESTRLFRNKR